MKFRNKISFVLIKWSMAFILPVTLMIISGGMNPEENSTIRSINKGFYFFVAFSAFYVIEEIKKYVAINDDHIYFNLFKFNKIKIMKNSSFGVKYEDILGIDSKFIPIFGLVSIKITARNIPEKIKISVTFRKHKKLYAEIVNRALTYNNDVYVDSDLENYLKKRGLIDEIHLINED